VAAENVAGGFSAVYPVLREMEERGRVRRGYFVEGLGGAQFCLPAALDRLRSERADPGGDDGPRNVLVLAAADPANPYGAALPWPSRHPEEDGGARPGRKAGALVALVDGELAWFVERGGRSLLSFTDDPDVNRAAAAALAQLVSAGRVGSILVERINGAAVLGPAVSAASAAAVDALSDAGFARTPRGLRLR
jgi:ATP-dependent helicase Lhr and Lhr-like helicase